MSPVSTKLCVLLNKTTAHAYYGYVNNKLVPFSSTILVLPLPDTNGVTQLECHRCKNGVGVLVGWYVGDSQSRGLTRYFNFLITSIICTSSSLACSKGSDSGERCGVKKAMKSRGGPLLLPRFYFFALLFTSHRSPLSECLEQATSSSANKLKTFISKLSHLERTGGLFESHDKAK